MERDAHIYQDLVKVLITREEIREAVRKLGARITADYQGKAPLVLCIIKGAILFFSDLIREIDLPLTSDFMAISSYGNVTRQSGEVKLIKDMDQPITGRDVLIVEDIVDTGKTLFYIKKMLSDRGAASIRIASLLDKPSRRTVDLEVEYSCFIVPNEFVVGYGLDFDEKYRNLPDIGVLKPELYGGR